MTRTTSIIALVAVASLALGCALGQAWATRRAPREVSCTATMCAAGRAWWGT